MTELRRPGNTVDNVYQTLRDRIIDGEYPPGTRMSQDGLATELSVSRTPLREALHRLEADGLLVAEANRGMEVSPITVGMVEECYAVRLLVEPPVIAALTDTLTDADLDSMSSALEEMEEHAHRIRDFQAAHLRFHELAVRRYPAAVQELTRSLHLKIYRHQRLFLSRPHMPEHFTGIDRIFLDALRARESDRARQILEFHLVDAAVGMVTDQDPDHRFTSLLVSARGVGIEIEHDPGGELARPATIDWPTMAPDRVADLKTANLLTAASLGEPKGTTP